ncbi:MAG TPA: hypothetical protein DCX07_02565 [Phycisphaerales bacterium]|nr:hypothetical protein [Phycisphaerales bacterium]
MSDSFTLTGGRTAGSALSGTTTEVGGKTWAASANTKFAGDANNGYVTLSTGNNEYGGVTISAPAQATALSVRLNTNGLPANQWISLGFLNQVGHPGGGNGKLWMILRPSGSFTIFANTTTLLNGTASNFSSTGFNQVEMIYSPMDETLTVKVNGLKQLDEADVSGYTLSIGAAGFAVNGTPTGAPAVDEFELDLIGDDLVSDAFEGHASGNSLNGTVTDVGNKTWAASGVTFSGTGVVNLGANSWANVPLTSTENDESLTVSAELQIAPSGGTWTALGFCNNSAASLSSSAKIWVLLWPSGGYTLYANGTSTTLSGSGSMTPGLNSTEFNPGNPYNRVDLTYNPSGRIVTLRLNETTVFEEAIEYDPGDTILAAGFQQNGTPTGTPAADNFRVMRSKPIGERPIVERDYNLMADMLRRFSDNVVSGRYFDSTAGVWYNPGANSWHCTAAPGCAAAALWNSLNDAGPDTGPSNAEHLQSQATYWDMAVKTIDTAIQFYDGVHTEYHQIAGGGFNEPYYEDYVTTPNEITTMFWGTLMAQAYIELEDHLDATRKNNWKNAIVGCVTFLKNHWNIKNGDHNWYTNGNIELGEALLLYQTWRITGEQTYLDQFEDQWDYLWDPPAPFADYGVTIEVTPTENDYSDGMGYLAEGGAYGIGYDPDYGQLQLSLATNLFLAADAEGDSTTRLKAQRLLNLLINKAFYGDEYHTPGISEDWILDCSYGSRHRFSGCPFNNPALQALYLLGDRDDFESDVLGQYNEVERSYRNVTMSSPSVNTYRGLEIDVAMFLLMSR